MKPVHKIQSSSDSSVHAMGFITTKCGETFMALSPAGLSNQWESVTCLVCLKSKPKD